MTTQPMQFSEQAEDMHAIASEELAGRAQMDAQDQQVELEARGWPGDGSGEDDLADFNANEADDYRDE